MTHNYYCLGRWQCPVGLLLLLLAPTPQAVAQESITVRDPQQALPFIPLEDAVEVGLKTERIRYHIAQPAPANPFADRLTGDWGGARTRLAKTGVTVDLDWTNYYQGMFSGTGNKDFEYGGRYDAFVTFDTTRLGWWKGGFIRTHTEGFYGDLSANLGGTVLPTNLGMRLPNPGKRDRAEITSLHLVQRINDRVNLIIGKINTVDLLMGDPFFGGTGDRRFMNLALAAPPNGLQPPVIMGGIVSLKTQPLDWTFMVFDPDDRTQGYLPDNLFSDGVNISVSAKRGTKIAGRTSSVSVTGIYSTQDQIDLRDVLLPPELRTKSRNGSAHFSIQFAHFLSENKAKPGDGWGFFAKVGLSDGNPNPYQSFFTGGIGGKSFIPSRPQDYFGLGYFYYNFSNDLQSTLNPLGRFEDESGFEGFYNYVINPWLHLTGDIQYVDPVIGANKNAFIGGLRLRVRL
jgi:porin